MPLATACNWDRMPSNSARIQCRIRVPFSRDRKAPCWGTAGTCAAAAGAPRGGAGAGWGVSGVSEEAAIRRTLGPETTTARAKTSGHPAKRPPQVVSQTEHVHADAPAFIGWLQPLVIWHPNSWHQPIGGPS